ncbi:hypothetical protein CVIRNUC_004630 [Coccomyxa viridis]|uniref:Glycosyl transferase family 25 domain-containing protein n=1 Tax=Coccomyxa viridis TaxID=1274662 RepID=A0AAV1I537_9CHLO|nr:hypothetical protein CVIRNUC_004630 [Coccomyxa viridis]
MAGRMRRYDTELPSRGGAGCYLSHLLVHKRLLESGDDAAFVFEDDASIPRKGLDTQIDAYLSWMALRGKLKIYATRYNVVNQRENTGGFDTHLDRDGTLRGDDGLCRAQIFFVDLDTLGALSITVKPSSVMISYTGLASVPL